MGGAAIGHVEPGLEEWRQIGRLHHAAVPARQTAASLGRHRSTIYRELARKRFTEAEKPFIDGYYGMAAQHIATRRRLRWRKLVRIPALMVPLDRLRADWSPE